MVSASPRPVALPHAYCLDLHAAAQRAERQGEYGLASELYAFAAESAMTDRGALVLREKAAAAQARAESDQEVRHGLAGGLRSSTGQTGSGLSAESMGCWTAAARSSARQ